MVGQTISHYNITEKLGEGGMGVVYKAEDTKLKRPVALKFLSPHLLSDTEAKERFIREAQAAAALNHPNICTVHEIDEAAGRTFIVMAFLEGASLDTKIEAGPLKLNEVLDFAIQTVQGLQAAHGKKIVHRDIKPANLMVTPQGAKQLVTIMDFGLAQLADRSKLTQGPTALGTVSYMSPEQAQGMELDHRTDLWALGVVIYEMVTGQRAFQGHYYQAITYSIQHEEPEPMTALRTGVPMELERITSKCLVKDREKRYQHTDELLLDLETLREKQKSGTATILRTGVATSTLAGPEERAGQAESLSLPHPLAKYRVIEDLEEADDSVLYRAEDTQLKRLVEVRVVPQSSAQRIARVQRHQQAALLGIAALGVLLALIFAFFWLSSPGPSAEPPLRRFSFSPEGLTGGRISPDGKYVLYGAETAGGSALWLRPLDSESIRKLEGTEGAGGGHWSPDSKSIVFGADRELKRISLDGGNPITLCELPSQSWPFFGASWSPDGNRIVFSSGLKLYEIAARGGEPKLLFEPEEAESNSNTAFWFPRFLPVTEGSLGLVYTFGPTPIDLKLGILDLKTGERWELVSGLLAVYSASGHLVYRESLDQTSGLRALPFSLETLTATGEAFPIVEAGRVPSMAQDGTLVYFDGGGRGQNLVWRDREGKSLGTIGQAQENIVHLALSPDGKSVAVAATDADGNADIWVHDVVRGAKTRLTFDPAIDLYPAWSPSGEQITFRSNRGGSEGIFSKPADGSGEAVLLGGEDAAGTTPDWSRDGKFVIYMGRRSGGADLWYLRPKAGGDGYESVPYLRTAADERIPVFSPDGRYVAYVSSESGRREIYVRPFSEGGGKWQVSINGGTQPRWRRDGRELFYVEGDQLMAVSVSMAQGFSPGTPKPLFRDRWLRSTRPDQLYDVSADGQRFVLREAVEGASDKPPAIRVVQNWYEEFRNREQD